MEVRKVENFTPPRAVRNSLNKLFGDIKQGEAVSINADDVNVNGLRTRQAQLNRKAGYKKYGVYLDKFTNQVRIAHLYPEGK